MPGPLDKDDSSSLGQQQRRLCNAVHDCSASACPLSHEPLLLSAGLSNLILHGTAINCDANDLLPLADCVAHCLLWCLLLQLQKLVATQEKLQQQLAAQVDLGNVKSGSHQQELQQLSRQLQQTEQQLQDVQDAMAAVVGKLQVC